MWAYYCCERNNLRDVKVMGAYDGHYEVDYDNVRVPKENLLGPGGRASRSPRTDSGRAEFFTVCVGLVRHSVHLI